MQKFEDLYPDAGKTLENSVLFYHRLIETFKFAFSRRMLLGDEYADAAVEETVKEAVANLTSQDFIDYVKNRIDDSKTYPSNSSHYDAQVSVT